MTLKKTLVLTLLVGCLPYAFALSGFALGAGCTPSPGGTPPAVSTSASVPPADPVTAACANLARLGCPEGKAAACVATMGHAQAANITPVNPACLAAASSPAAARACGFVACATP